MLRKWQIQGLRILRKFQKHHKHTPISRAHKLRKPKISPQEHQKYQNNSSSYSYLNPRRKTIEIKRRTRYVSLQQHSDRIPELIHSPSLDSDHRRRTMDGSDQHHLRKLPPNATSGDRFHRAGDLTCRLHWGLLLLFVSPEPSRQNAAAPPENQASNCKRRSMTPKPETFTFSQNKRRRSSYQRRHKKEGRKTSRWCFPASEKRSFARTFKIEATAETLEKQGSSCAKEEKKRQWVKGKVGKHLQLQEINNFINTANYRRSDLNSLLNNACLKLLSRLKPTMQC